MRTNDLDDRERTLAGRETQAKLVRLVATVWTRGWQPSEIVRHARRQRAAPTADLALLAIAAEHAERGAVALDPRWRAQLDALDLPPVDPTSGWLAAWAAREPQAMLAIAMLEGCLMVGPLPIIIPPPGAERDFRTPMTPSVFANDPMLVRVRALLAQAESTTFEAEAETFTAKAQELMTRHAIDDAMLDAGTHGAGSRGSEQPTSIRIPIDEPYLKAKAVLLFCVAQHSRCRAVLHSGIALATIIGLPNDITATELLFTSLLVQSQTALRAAAARSTPGAHERSRGFRSSFVIAYAHRIGERLAEINAAILADVEAETNQSLLPVLVARSALVDAAVDEMFTKLKPLSSRIGVDGAGWESGRLAADRARLNAADLPRPKPRLGTGAPW